MVYVEVLSLATRHHSLEMTEIADVTDLLLAVERQHSCEIAVVFGLAPNMKRPDVQMTVTAFQIGRDVGEVIVLASVSVTCSAMNLRGWNAALTHAMYALDFKFALAEFDAKASESV
jgi:hypothetical protein